MPFYNFECPSCNAQTKRLLPAKDIEKRQPTCQACGSAMERRMGTPEPLGKQTLDEYRGLSVSENLKDKLTERSNDHFRKHEIPRLIEKHGREYALQRGWIDLEGNIKGGNHKK